MSQENVELVRRMCEAYVRNDVEAASAPLHPDIEWDITRYGLPDLESFSGKGGVPDFFSAFLRIWTDYEADFEEFIDVGDRVVVYVSERAKGKGSGVAVGRDWAQVWTVHDGLATRFEAFRDRDEALATALLEQWAASWNAWDVDALLALLHPDVEIRGIRAALEDTTYKGLDEARRFFHDSKETWTSVTAEMVEREVYDDRAFERLRLTLVARGSGAEIVREVGVLYEFEGARIRAFITYLEPDDAREAAQAAPGYPAER